MSENRSQHYVYGVTEAEQLAIDAPAIAGAQEVSLLEHRDLAAVRSVIDAPEVERTDENMRAHDEVLREVLESGRTVVPMSFGMVFATEAALRNVLDGAYPSLRNALDELSNTVELGLKVVSPPSGGPDPREIHQAAAETVDQVSLAMVDNDLFSDRLLLNRAYLVNQDETDAFGEAVATFEDRATPDTMIQYTGPWAPYNFVDIEIGAKQ